MEGARTALHSLTGGNARGPLLLGLGFTLLFYLALFGYAGIVADTTLANLSARLASGTGAIVAEVTTPISAEQPLQPTLPVSDLKSPAHGHAAPVAGPSDTTTKVAEMLPNKAAASGTNGDAKNTAGDGVQDESMVAASKALPPSPINGLTEDSPFGPLPIRGPEGLTPFEAYKKPHRLNRDRAALALVVLNYGLSDKTSALALAMLPDRASFVLSPYAAEPEHWQSKAREAGFEIWLNLPVENKNFPFEDPGYKGLLSRVNLQYNLERLQWLLGRFTGYAGIAAYSDTSLESARPMFSTLSQNFFKRGLGYLELNPARKTFFEDLAITNAAPNAHAHFELPASFTANDPALGVVKNFLRDQGGAIVVLRPNPANLKAAVEWLKTLQAEGVELVPVSALAALGAQE